MQAIKQFDVRDMQDASIFVGMEAFGLLLGCAENPQPASCSQFIHTPELARQLTQHASRACMEDGMSRRGWQAPAASGASSSTRHSSNTSGGPGGTIPTPNPRRLLQPSVTAELQRLVAEIDTA